MGNKTYDSSSKKKDFLPQNDKIWPKLGIFGQFGPGHAGLFGALLAGRLVVADLHWWLLSKRVGNTKAVKNHKVFIVNVV